MRRKHEETPAEGEDSTNEEPQALLIDPSEEMRIALEEALNRADLAEKALLYARAEFQNISRRRDEQAAAERKYAVSELVKSLLPVIDNFERGLQSAEQTRNFEALVEGIHGTRKQLETALEKAGVTPIESVGKEFDPMIHEALGPAEESDYPPNTVAEELQRGYKMHDRVIRPALVKVVQAE